MTYSLIALDEATGELGVAVQSHAFGTGAGVPWVRAGVGAVATQSFTNRGYGPLGLEQMASGVSSSEALANLLEADEQRDLRQVAFLDARGNAAAHTGADCIPDCGHLTGPGFAAQGNMLASTEVWPAMAEVFVASRGTLAERLLASLDAAEAAGGDFRGRQAAALLVVPGQQTDEPWNDIVFNLRVDDHDEPLVELRRLHRLAAGYRRRNRIGADASPEEEVDAARAAGLADEEVALAGALAEAQSGDLAAAAARLVPFVAADTRWFEAYVRYERLGFLPPGVVDRLRP